MFLDKKTLYFLWYLLQLDLDKLIVREEEGAFPAEILLEALEYLKLKIESTIDVTENRHQWFRTRKRAQSGNHINKKYAFLNKKGVGT